MDRMIYLSMSGAKAALQRQDSLANNLANVSTNGFRAELTAFRAVPVRGDGASTRVFALETTPGYNDAAGANADGHYAWIAQNGLKGVRDFDDGLDGTNHGLMIPVLYPGFNSYYAQGGWSGPTWKVSYSLKPDNTEGGDTFTSTFELGKYAGDLLQIATWNDYGEGTMVEPTNQFGYKFLTTLQQLVGATYTDAELKIVKLLYDQRKQFGGSKQQQLDQASTALANLDLATACGILGCTVPAANQSEAMLSTAQD